MPWINLHVSTSGRISPCCEFDGDIGALETRTLKEAWESAELRDIRATFAAGKPVAACWKCHDRECNEGASLRTQSNELFARWMAELEQAGNLADAAPEFPVSLDLRMSNLCNFSCRSCWHGASSKWFRDGKALGVVAAGTAEIRAFRSAGEVLEQIGDGLDSMERLYFAGGEPLLMEEHYALLTELVARGRTGIALAYNSNMSVRAFRKQSIYDLWTRFDSVQVSASVDAHGARGAMIRKGFDWQTFVGNVNELRRRCPHVRLDFGITVSAFNVLILTDLLRRLEDDCAAVPAEFFPHSLQAPSHYRSQVLPRPLKDKAERHIEDYIAELETRMTAHDEGVQALARALRGIAGFMNAQDLSGEARKLAIISARLDRLRGEDSRVVLPELSGVLNTPKRRMRDVMGIFGRRPAAR